MDTPAFSIEINRSRCQRIYCLILRSLFLITFFYLPFWIVILLVVLSCLYWLYVFLYQSRLIKGSALNINRITQLHYREQNWWLCLASSERGRELQLYELVQATVWRWLIVMRFYSSDEKKFRSLIIWPDSVNEPQRCHLKIVLRHQSVFKKAEES